MATTQRTTRTKKSLCKGRTWREIYKDILAGTGITMMFCGSLFLLCREYQKLNAPFEQILCTLVSNTTNTLKNNYCYEDNYYYPGSTNGSTDVYVQYNLCECNAPTLNYELIANVSYQFKEVVYTNQLCGSNEETMCDNGNKFCYDKTFHDRTVCGKIYHTDHCGSAPLLMETFSCFVDAMDPRHVFIIVPPKDNLIILLWFLTILFGLSSVIWISILIVRICLYCRARKESNMYNSIQLEDGNTNLLITTE